MVVYFAAIEAGDALDLIPENAFRCAFFSYYYCRKGQAKNDILIKSRPYMKLITIDSGAHSFFSVDSSSWKAAAQYGAGRVVAGQKTKIVRYKDPQALKDVDLHHNWREAYSDNKRLNRNQRYRMAIQAFQKLADEDTTFWEANGITYPEWNKYAKNQHGQ